MKVGDLMTSNPILACATDSIASAAELMGSADIGSVPVIENRDGGRLIGMLTDRDIVLRCTAKRHDATKCTVEQHMTREDLATARPDTPLTELIEMMERSQVRRVPVVSDGGHVVGIVAQADLARGVGPNDPALVEQMLVRVSAPSAPAAA